MRLTGWRAGSIAGLVGLCGCADEPASVSSADTTADLVMQNGEIYTVDAARSWADAVAIKGEHIVYVGPDSGARAFISANTKVVDLNGRWFCRVFKMFISIHPGPVPKPGTHITKGFLRY